MAWRVDASERHTLAILRIRAFFVNHALGYTTICSSVIPGLISLITCWLAIQQCGNLHASRQFQHRFNGTQLHHDAIGAHDLSFRESRSNASICTTDVSNQLATPMRSFLPVTPKAAKHIERFCLNSG